MKVAMSMQNTHFVCHDKSDRVSELLKFIEKNLLFTIVQEPRGGGIFPPSPGTKVPNVFSPIFNNELHIFLVFRSFYFS